MKVTDFGIAATIIEAAETVPLGEQRTVTIERVRGGTPGFMPPEVIHGEGADRRSDLFALGCVLYECLTAKHPFLAETREKTDANVLRVDPPRPSSLNPAVWPRLDAVTLKLLEKKPEDRYQSSGEVVAALEAVDQPAPVITRARWYNRRAFAWTAFVAGVLIGIVVLLTFILNPPIPPDAMKRYRQGLDELEDGTYFNAALRFQQAINLYRDFTMAHAHLAEAWDELDFADEAKKEMLKAVPGWRIKPEDALHLEAIRATVTGDLGKAASLFKELAERVSGADRAEALLDLGRVYDRAEKRKEAAEAYEAAARADPQSGAPFLRLGTVYVTLREPDKAAEALTKAEANYRLANKSEGLTECLYARARLENKPAESLRILEEALNQATFNKNEQQQIKILLLMSNKYVSLGNSDKAIETADAALNLARTARLENMATRGLIDTAVAIWRTGGNTERAKQYLETAHAIAQRSGSKRNEARAEGNLASLLINMGDIDHGITYARQALSFYRAGGYRSETASTLIIIADADESRGFYDAAMRGYLDAIDTIRSLGRSLPLAQVKSRIAELFMDREDFVSARKWYTESLDTASSLGLRDIVASVTAALGEIAAWLGHDSEARRYIENGEWSLGHLTGDAAQYLPSAKGIVALAAGRYSAAAQALQAALDSGKVDQADVKCSLTIALGLALVRSGRLSEGSDVCSRGVKIADDLRSPQLGGAAALAMAECLVASGHRIDAALILRKVLPEMEKEGRKESAWRGWALLAKVESGNEAKQAATRARGMYNQLTATWDAVDRVGYSSRPDIRKLLRLIDSIYKG